MPCVMLMLDPEELTGQYLESFDHDGADGFGYGIFTDDPSKAMKFTDAKSALDFWKKKSMVRPLRADGRPNRPLTASTITLEQVP